VSENAAHAPDYLRLPFAWAPSRRFDHGLVYEYRLVVRTDDIAILRLVAGKGWTMTLARGGAQAAIEERGLFGTPQDALMVLFAEFVSSRLWAEAEGAPEARALSPF
jgi:hypothetical protein